MVLEERVIYKGSRRIDLDVLLVGELVAARQEVGFGLGVGAGHIGDAFEPMLATKVGREGVVLELPK